MSFSLVAAAYIVSIAIDSSLLFFTIFHIIAFDELKTDYKDPIEQCKILNPLVLPEYGLHFLINLLFLLTGEWISVVINLPLIAYHVYRYKTRPVMSDAGLYDPTIILDRTVLSKCLTEVWLKLAFYLLTFVYYVFSLIYCLIY